MTDSLETRILARVLRLSASGSVLTRKLSMVLSVDAGLVQFEASEALEVGEPLQLQFFLPQGEGGRFFEITAAGSVSRVLDAAQRRYEATLSELDEASRACIDAFNAGRNFSRQA